MTFVERWFIPVNIKEKRSRLGLFVSFIVLAEF